TSVVAVVVAGRLRDVDMEVRCRQARTCLDARIERPFYFSGVGLRKRHANDRLNVGNLAESAERGHLPTEPAGYASHAVVDRFVAIHTHGDDEARDRAWSDLLNRS